MPEQPTIVIGIPGRWTDRTAIIETIAKDSGGYMFVGMTLTNLESNWSCELDVCEHDPDLRRAFETAGSGRIDDSTLDEIGAHSFILYLSCDGGALDKARALMNAATAMLDCGGLAVKIESTGIAHTTERWQELTEQDVPGALMDAYVTYVGGDGSYYSCGMHNLGARDTVVTADILPNDAARLLFTLNSYVAHENAIIGDGETFSVDPESPHFRVHMRPCDMFSPDDLFHNPYGIWDLTPV